MANEKSENQPQLLRSPGAVLLMAASRWLVLAEGLFAKHEVSAIQVRILIAADTLHGTNGPAHQADIARWAGLDVMTLSKNVRLLESAGFVLRAPHPTDSRARTVAVTEKGRAKLMKIEKGLAKLDAKVFGDIGGLQKMRKTLTSFLRQNA